MRFTTVGSRCRQNFNNFTSLFGGLRQKLKQKACHTCSTIVDTVHSHGCRHGTLEYMLLCVYGTKCFPDGQSMKINSLKVLIFHPVEGVRLTVVFNSGEAKTRQS